MEYRYFTGYSYNGDTGFAREEIWLDFRILTMDDVSKLESRLKELHSYSDVKALSYLLLHTKEA